MQHLNHEYFNSHLILMSQFLVICKAISSPLLTFLILLKSKLNYLSVAVGGIMRAATCNHKHYVSPPPPFSENFSAKYSQVKTISDFVISEYHSEREINVQVKRLCALQLLHLINNINNSTLAARRANFRPIAKTSVSSLQRGNHKSTEFETSCRTEIASPQFSLL